MQILLQKLFLQSLSSLHISYQYTLYKLSIQVLLLVKIVVIQKIIQIVKK